ncbi:hypothetical protein CVT25_011900 [Psilocybe cyanescens]|uniref:SH3b domain-containing protein n=1 Tax=Psilocybe cyanescens TaxID=93625 RepID=A0A409XV56_PSICY|nr:hypothetical protein CVT25_011900 [Psilocybe cyanescens]
MKFTFATAALALALSAITPALALPEPAPAVPEPTVYNGAVAARSLEKRTNSGTVVVDGLRYRTCPKTSCTAVGQYAKGTHITIVCYTRDGTTPVDGDAGWAKLTNGYWVALAFGHYVSWSVNRLPHIFVNMKFTYATAALALALSAFTPALGLPEPVPATPEPTVYSGPVPNSSLEARANSATVLVDGLRYRTCPKTSCTAVGQYAKGTKVTINCYTRAGTTVVEGDAGWGKLTNGYWVALANGKYVTWTGAIPYCS